MKKLKDYTLEWCPSGTRIYSRCQVQLFQSVRSRSDREEVVIIITELSNNPGRSITNGAEQIASLILLQHNLKAFNVKFIEHYIRKAPEPDTWDLLSFNIVRGQLIAGPRWAPGQWKLIAQMIDAPKKQWTEL